MSSFCRALALLAVPAALVMLASCGADKIVPPCPPVRIDNATADLTRFKDGAQPGDSKAVEYRAHIAGYKGECRFGKNKVDVSMNIDFTLEPGPAAKAGEPVTLYYFLAIPQFFPQPEGKRILTLTHALPAYGHEPAQMRESNVHVTIPLKKDQPAAAFDVYVGLQLTQAQLDYNRAHPLR
jgi:hypothetical protein